ncbi:D-2-hydroxyacid dehydrogenase [Candidatus Poribacteria bacterium]|nr:D-2-hydroxyacid dehydrogenase [Candidatus Poribacteria bacterium]
MSEVTILLRREFYEQHRARLHSLAPSARFETFADRDEMLAKLPTADALYGASPRDDILVKCPRLKWLHMRSAGVDKHIPDALSARGITLTKGSGAYDIPISEHILAMMLALARGLPRYIRNQSESRWDRGGGILQLHGRTLGVYGMGSIGTELGRKARALGMVVHGIALRPRTKPSFARALWTPDRLDDLLALSDHLAVCVPLTAATEKLFGAREFGLMKPTAFFYNIGRGGTVVQEALIDALRSGGIAGAGLDVTDPEPLPMDSPLWSMPNVVVTPHVSGTSDGTDARADRIVLENIRRFATGEPLLNVVSYEHGY